MRRIPLWGAILLEIGLIYLNIEAQSEEVWITIAINGAFILYAIGKILYVYSEDYDERKEQKSLEYNKRVAVHILRETGIENKIRAVLCLKWDESMGIKTLETILLVNFNTHIERMLFVDMLNHFNEQCIITLREDEETYNSCLILDKIIKEYKNKQLNYI